jgi:peptide/nickel transport system substrate-binding protein
MNNADFDKLYNAANTESDPAKRLKDLQDAEAIMVDEAIGIWLYETPAVNALQKNVTGFRPRPDQVIDVFLMGKS